MLNKSILRQVTKPLCNPVSLAQARRHLNVDVSDSANNMLIEMLIGSATTESQTKTGRIWVESVYEWRPESIELNNAIRFPIVPVTEMYLYDVFEKMKKPVINQGGENDNITDNPEEIIPPLDNVENPDFYPDMPLPEAPLPEAPKPVTPPVAWEEVVPVPKDYADFETYTNLASEYFDISYPSLDSLGYPVIGEITLRKPLPEKYKIFIKAGYPVTSHEELVELADSPVLNTEATQYGYDKIYLVFDRPIQGDISLENFELRNVTLDNAIMSLDSVEIRDGAVLICAGVGQFSALDVISLSFFGGALYDKFDNYVQPINCILLPSVSFVENETAFLPPPPLPMENIYESTVPPDIQAWILFRVGSLFTQRTGIALRAGKSNDSLFPDRFVNDLLNPYRVRFLC